MSSGKTDRDERWHRGGDEPVPEIDLEPGFLRDLHADRVAEVAVIHSADETARLAIVQNMR